MQNAGFVSTQWSLVLAARDRSTPEGAVAFAALCSVYWPPLYAYIRRLGHMPEDAQDLTQETFIKALQREDQLKDEKKAAHWLSRIATNTALDFLRRHGRVTMCELESAPEMSSDTPEQILLRTEHHEYLADGLRLLSPRERAALLLRDVEGLPAEEVARRLDCSKATVRSHIANARTKFRRYMERRKR